MKYLIVAHGRLEMPVVFSSLMKHADVAASMGAMPAAGSTLQVVAAGFCSIVGAGPDKGDGHSIDVVTFGESVSLGVGRRPQDRAVITGELARPDL